MRDRLELPATAANIGFWVDPVYGVAVPVIARTITELLHMIGWRSRQCLDPDSADLIYSPGVSDPWRCGTAEDWADAISAAPPERAREILFSPHLAGLSSPDPIRAAYVLLTGRHEAAIEQPGQNVPGKRLRLWGLDSSPSLDLLSLEIRERIVKLTGKPARPRWPKGKSWALVLSHDCDRPYQYRRIGYARDAVEFASRGRPVEALRSVAQSLYSVVMGALRPDPYVDSMRRFIAFERTHGLTGTYYFGVWSRRDAESTPDDLPYNHRDHRAASLAREAVEAGMEIGLHSGILAWKSPRFAEEAERFEQAYGQRPRGVRAHFWSLEPGQPERSLRAMADAGFSYDSSLGMNEVNGFRRGTCYPFMPFDPEDGTSCALIELPVTLMDDSLPREAGPRAWIDTVNTLSNAVRRAEGCLMLDWHSDTMTSPRWSPMTKVVMAEVADLARDETCWLASAGEVAHWAAKGRWHDET